MNLVAETDRVHPLHRYRPPRSHPKRTEPVGDQLGVRREVHDPLDAARVIRVVMCQPHPLQLVQVHDRADRSDEVITVDADAGVDEHGFLCHQQVGVDW
jgi:hypothetical protein